MADELNTTIGESKKPWYKSTGAVASVLTMVASALGILLGVDIDKEIIEQGAIVFVSGVTTITGAIALYGRIKAKQGISFRKEKPE